MAEETSDTSSDSSEKTEISRDAWPDWCRTATEKQAGRVLKLHYTDEAIGEVRLAEGMPFVAISHEELGSAVAFTIQYGDDVVPMRHVVAEPRSVTQTRDDAGEVEQVVIVDSTRRRTYLSLE